MTKHKILLEEDDMPTYWYNILSDLPYELSPLLHPKTQMPISQHDLTTLFPKELVEQEFTKQRWIAIPEEVQQLYRLWRPTPLIRATRWEHAIRTNSKIFYKHEATSPVGNYTLNTAIAQTFYNYKNRTKRLTTDTGGGQWGSALALACSLFGLKSTVYMVKSGYQQKPYRRFLMSVWGANILPSPSNTTQCGQRLLAEVPDSPGSSGIAMSEAVEDATYHEDTCYSIGMIFNYVFLHQSIIGQEAKKQLESIGEYPDYIFGCSGGGSDLPGIGFPFLKDKIQGRNIKFIVAEPSSSPVLTKGHYAYDFIDTAKELVLLKMYTLGHDFIPPEIQACGLRYHGESPVISLLYAQKMIDAVSCRQNEVFESAVEFAKTEGVIPSPESAHTIAAVRKTVMKSDKNNVILFSLSGHGLFDLSAYDRYLAGALEDFELPETRIREALVHLPKINVF